MAKLHNRKTSSLLKIQWEAMGWAIFAVVLIRLFCIAPLEVSGPSMLPLLNGNKVLSDRVLYNRLVYHFISPKRGDVVVYEEPDPLDSYKKIKSVRRIAALPGETVYIKNERLFINGRTLEDPFFKNQRYIFRAESGMDYGGQSRAEKVPEGSYYLLGDNTEESRDSRQKGYVSGEKLEGRVFFRYWPFSRWGRIHSSRDSVIKEKGVTPSK